MSARPASSRDVARLAAVSQATVSAVMNNARFVMPETRQRVLQAVAQLGYRPNAVAQSLKTHSSRVFGIAVPALVVPWWANVVQAIDEASVSEGYRILLVQTLNESSREARGVEDLVDQRVAGLIVVPSLDTNVEDILRIAGQIPTVVLNRHPAPAKVDGVVFDDHSGARAATEHLIGHGRRRIAAILQPQRHTAVRDRLLGYQEATRAAGLPTHLFVEARGWDRPEGERTTREIIGREPRIDALFVHSHLMAIGALASLEALGRRVPDDVALIGYEELPWNDQLRVPLSVVVQSAQQYGATAVQVLVRRLREPLRGYEEVVLLQTRIFRQSCGCPSLRP